MSRQARVVAEAVPHHVTQRGNNRQDIFLTDKAKGTKAKGTEPFTNRKLRIVALARTIRVKWQPWPAARKRIKLLRGWSWCVNPIC